MARHHSSARACIPIQCRSATRRQSAVLEFTICHGCGRLQRANAQGQSFSLSPTKLGDRYRLDELTFADTAATGGNAPFPAVALMFAGSVKNRLRQRDGFKRNIIQVTIT